MALVCSLTLRLKLLYSSSCMVLVIYIHAHESPKSEGIIKIHTSTPTRQVSHLLFQRLSSLSPAIYHITLQSDSAYNVSSKRVTVQSWASSQDAVSATFQVFHGILFAVASACCSLVLATLLLSLKLKSGPRR
ncbi:hypothetical protein F4604DRAFT_1746735 [Suillus subluteus]|nr:hypothetical protein F4604DRAFT_1746735 [Suillus subluteus]